MSVSLPLENRVPCSGEGNEFRREIDPDRVVEFVSDADAVDLFQSATSPKTVAMLAEECDLPLSTTYRKVENLQDAGLLRRTTPESANGSPPGRYERTVNGVAVTVTDEVVVEYLVAEER